jgi:rhamnogalacturonyl hydrolase YesR
MAPQAFAHISNITGDKRYMQFMDEYWWKTSDHLYSRENSFFYRDDSYFNKRTKNGKKIFWGRGNGWVIGGLVRVLNLLPPDYPNRKKFEVQFQQMSAKMFHLQQADGLWGVSLLDNYDVKGTESSASTLITHALAWGINNGLIDRKYTKNVIKAWDAFTGRVNNQGRLGYVQQAGALPFPFSEEQYQVYASGSYLLLGCEMLKLSHSLK